MDRENGDKENDGDDGYDNKIAGDENNDGFDEDGHDDDNGDGGEDDSDGANFSSDDDNGDVSVATAAAS